jgi:hypothetical protein
MWNSGKKIILTLVLSEKKILNETKNHNPTPFKINGRSLMKKHVSLFEEWHNRCDFPLLLEIPI